jgi:tripartite-type tricarboxylate transporter receptor subunit TctC
VIGTEAVSRAAADGNTLLMVGNSFVINPHLRKLNYDPRALATGSRTRIELLPEVPTFAESGYKDYEVENWFGVIAPAKTPKKTMSQLIGWYARALQPSEIKAKLVA